MHYRGCCLCGQVVFLVKRDIYTLYHCHCSLCRRQSGTGANAATLVNFDAFQWLSGETEIRHYRKDKGFKSDFCGRCGSPVPNQVGATSWMWIPLGLLDTQPQILNKLNFCLSSKVDWLDPIQANENYPKLPTADTLKLYFDQ